MPIYEYECLDCGKHCEVIQKFSDELLSVCPECGGHLHKLISHNSFILKGTGWYVTDYASQDRKSTIKSESKPVTKAGPKTEAAAKN